MDGFSDCNKMELRKKRLLIACVFLVAFLFLPSVQAQSNNSEGSFEDSARSCVRDKVEDRGCSSLGIEDQVFSLLSTGQCKSNLSSKSINGECFGVNSCNVKHTAQASLALDNAGVKTDNYTSWIRSRNTTVSGLDWFVQLDTKQPTSCSLRDLDGSSYEVSVNSDKALNLDDGGSCLSVSDNGYWLEVDSSCYDQEFEISCEDSFSSSLLFRRDQSSTVYVTDEISSSSAGGATIEKMQSSLCLPSGSSGSCSYEDTLWGVMALEDLGENASEYYPYLVAFAEENEELLPESFLYQLTGDRNYRSELILKQKADKYWRETDNRYYDTAIALMSLSGESPEAKSNSIDWLENQQEQDGCWNKGSIRDTGFLVHSLWPKSQGTFDDGGISDDINDSGDDVGDQQVCEDGGYYCVDSIECTESGGEILDSYTCSGFGERCCTQEPKDKSCSGLGGEICASSEKCDGSIESNATGLGIGETCCVGSCEPEDEGNDAECINNDGICKSQCGEEEYESSTFSCSSSAESCCMQKTEESSEPVSVWIWVLTILIIITVLAIVFKDKIKQFYLRLKSKDKSKGSRRGPPGPGSNGGPPGPPPGKPPKSPPKKVPKKMPKKVPPKGPGQGQPPGGGRSPPNNQKKKEIDDVLGKLKEIGK